MPRGKWMVSECAHAYTRERKPTKQSIVVPGNLTRKGNVPVKLSAHICGTARWKVIVAVDTNTLDSADVQILELQSIKILVRPNAARRRSPMTVIATVSLSVQTSLIKPLDCVAVAQPAAGSALVSRKGG